MSSVDVFGRYLQKSKQSVRGPPGLGFKRTIDGDYDIENKRLCNIAEPVENTDAATLISVHQIIKDQRSKESVHGPPGNGFKHTKDGNYDIDNKRLCNIAEPVRNTDAATLFSVHHIIKDYIINQKEFVVQMYNNLGTKIPRIETKLNEIQNEQQNLKLKLNILEQKFKT